MLCVTAGAWAVESAPAREDVPRIVRSSVGFLNSVDLSAGRIMIGERYYSLAIDVAPAYLQSLVGRQVSYSLSSGREGVKVVNLQVHDPVNGHR